MSDNKLALIEAREELRALAVRQRTHGFRIAQLEAAQLRAPASATVQGEPGPEGPPGPQGEIGPKPRHKWTGTALAFENPDGTFDDPPIELKGERGRPGASAGAAGFGGPATTTTTTNCNGYFPGGW